MARTYAAIYERRKQRAVRAGWDSFWQGRKFTSAHGLPMGRMAYWTPAERKRVEALARACCGSRRHEAERAGSIFCRHCNDRVNGAVHTARQAAYKPRERTWQERLVRVAATVKRRRAAARKGRK